MIALHSTAFRIVDTYPVRSGLAPTLTLLPVGLLIGYPELVLFSALLYTPFHFVFVLRGFGAVFGLVGNGGIMRRINQVFLSNFGVFCGTWFVSSFLVGYLVQEYL